MNGLPPVTELLPHRAPMLLIDRVVDFGNDALVAEYAPRADAWYADACEAGGAMPGWIGIELMAQAVAAHVALKKRQSGLPPKMGALLGTRSYRMLRPAVASFPAGQTLRIAVAENFRDASGLAAYECRIEDGAGILAQALLKVYEPDDFGSFVQGNRQ